MNKKIMVWIFAVIMLLVTIKGAAAYCNETLIVTHSNQSLSSSDYNITTTRTCTTDSNDNTSGIAIVIFILAITGSLFLLSMKKEILRNKYTNLIVRRAFLVLGIYLMILNAAIMATLAATSNIPLVQEMFFYMRLFGYIGYPAMIFLMLSALLQSMKEWKLDKRKKRTGEENGD